MYCPYCNYEHKNEVSICPHCNTPLIQSPSQIDSKSPSHPSKYLNDLEEWNKHQYNPGHWTGANIPPHISVLSKVGNKPIGIIALICGIFILGNVINALLNTDFHNAEELITTITASIVGGFLGIILVWAGILRIKVSSNENK